jgi:hypothetical protein
MPLILLLYSRTKPCQLHHCPLPQPKMLAHLQAMAIDPLILNPLNPVHNRKKTHLHQYLKQLLWTVVR